MNCFRTGNFIYVDTPLLSTVSLVFCQTGLTLLFLHFHSWFVAEGCGRYSHHEAKEMGCGTRADGAVPVSVHLSLPQTGSQWTAGENKDRLVVLHKNQICRNTSSGLWVLWLQFFLLFCFFFVLQFIYVNQSFAPSPDQDVGALFDVSKHRDLFQLPTQHHYVRQVRSKMPNHVNSFIHRLILTPV